MLALLQLVSAAWIFRKLPWPRPRWIPGFHRWTGRLVLVVTLPVAYHCIFNSSAQSRRLVESNPARRKIDVLGGSV